MYQYIYLFKFFFFKQECFSNLVKSTPNLLLLFSELQNLNLKLLVKRAFKLLIQIYPPNKKSLFFYKYIFYVMHEENSYLLKHAS